MREGAIRWFDETLGPRLDSKSTGRTVVIEQRTHQADLTGHLLTQGGWRHVPTSGVPAEDHHRDAAIGARFVTLV
jgi:hypothetical protein